MQDDMYDVDDAEEIHALGCSSGAGAGGLAGIGGVFLLLAWQRRRRHSES
jgi:MYXO-CTERM domain-containing protein